MKRDEKYVKVRHRVVVFECKDVLFELATVKSGSSKSMRERGGVDLACFTTKTLVLRVKQWKKKKSVPTPLGSLELLID